MPSTNEKKFSTFGDDFFPPLEEIALLLASEGSQRCIAANGISILNCRSKLHQSRITNETILADHAQEILPGTSVHRSVIPMLRYTDSSAGEYYEQSSLVFLQVLVHVSTFRH